VKRSGKRSAEMSTLEGVLGRIVKRSPVASERGGRRDREGIKEATSVVGEEGEKDRRRINGAGLLGNRLKKKERKKK